MHVPLISNTREFTAYLYIHTCTFLQYRGKSNVGMVVTNIREISAVCIEEMIAHINNAESRCFSIHAYSRLLVHTVFLSTFSVEAICTPTQ